MGEEGARSRVEEELPNSREEELTTRELVNHSSTGVGDTHHGSYEHSVIRRLESKSSRRDRSNKKRPIDPRSALHYTRLNKESSHEYLIASCTM